MSPTLFQTLFTGAASQQELTISRQLAELRGHDAHVYCTVYNYILSIDFRSSLCVAG